MQVGLEISDNSDRCGRFGPPGCVYAGNLHFLWVGCALTGPWPVGWTGLRSQNDGPLHTPKKAAGC